NNWKNCPVSAPRRWKKYLLRSIITIQAWKRLLPRKRRQAKRSLERRKRRLMKAKPRKRRRPKPVKPPSRPQQTKAPARKLLRVPVTLRTRNRAEQSHRAKLQECAA